MSPTTKIFGYPGIEQSGATLTRPMRSVCAPVACAISCASGAARTPAAQIRVIAGIVRSAPAPSRTEIESTSRSVTIVRTWISTPSRSSAFDALPERRALKVGRIRSAPSNSMIRACAGSKCRKLRASELRASSPICPASSTPVGPPPTIAKVSHAARRASSVSHSAISNAPKIRPRSRSASSIVFIPGAHCSKRSLPKYEVVTPPARIRLS